MTTTFRAAGTGVNSAGATTLAPVVPAGAQVGDTLILAINVNTAVAQTFTGLSSWTQQKNLSVNSPVLAVYTKTAVLADIGATLAPAWGTSAACSAWVIAYSGVDTAVTAVDASGSGNAVGVTTVQYGSLTAPMNDTIVSIGAMAGAVNPGVPTSYTSRLLNSANAGLNISEANATPKAGASGSITSTSSALNSQGVLLALRPAQVPVFRASGAQVSAPTATTVSPSSPASTQIGDLLIAECGAATATGTVWNTPVGWTLAGTQANGAAVFYKFAAAAGATAQAFTISTAAVNIGAAIHAYSGVGSVDATGATSFGAVTSITSPSLTSLGADRVYVAANQVVGSVTATSTPAAGMTEQFDGPISAGGLGSVTDEATPVSGTATGTRAFTLAAAGTGGNAVALLLAPPANRSKLRAVAKNAVSAGTSLSVTLPATLAAGDLMVMTVAWATTLSAIVPPTGWVEVESDIAGTNGEWFKAYTKTAVGGEANPSVTWTTAATASATVSVIVGSGTLDVDGHTVTAASVTNNFPSVTTVRTADLLLFIGHCDAITGGYTPPAGAALVLDDVTTHRADLSYEVVNGAVATGARTGTFGTLGDNTGYVIAIAADTAPNAPTLTAPANASTADLASGYTFTWTFSDPDAGDTQSAYYLRRKIAGAGSYEYWNAGTSSWQGTEVKNATATASVTFAAGKWTSGNVYNWSVATEDSFGTKGAYASDFTVTAGNAPTVTVTAPTGTVSSSSMPTVTWTYSDTEGDPQQTYQVKIESGAYGSTPGSGTAVWDSTELSGSATRSVVIGVSLANGTTYRAFVRSSQSGSQYSSWAFSTFTLSLNPPAQPTLTAVADNVNGRVTLVVQGRDNLLEANTASVETDVTGWTVDTNCTLAQSATDAVDGTKSLAMTSAAAGAMRARTTTRYAVTVGQTYTAVASFKTAVSIRAVRILIRWYTLQSGGVLVSTTTGGSVNDATTGYTQAFATTAAPATGVWAELALEVLATAAASEVHRVDVMDIGPGSSVVWTAGGLTTATTAQAQYSDDAGVTWANVRGASAAPFDSAADQIATVYDYESPPNTARSYRAFVNASV